MAKYRADVFAVKATVEHRAADFDLRFQNFGDPAFLRLGIYGLFNAHCVRDEFSRHFTLIALLSSLLSGWLGGTLKTLTDYFSFGKYH